MHGPAEGGGFEIGVGCFEGRIALEKQLDSGGVAVPGGPMKGGGVVLAARVDGKAGFEKETKGKMIAFASGVGKRGGICGWELRAKV